MERGPALVPVPWAGLLSLRPELPAAPSPEKPCRRDQDTGFLMASEVQMKHCQGMTPHYLKVNVYLL